MSAMPLETTFALERSVESVEFSNHVDAILLAVTGRIQEQKFPSSTYRVQLNKHCTFRQLMEYVPTLSEMGISHVYLAPFLESRPGSVHGYDIVNHSKINPEIGSMEDLRSLSRMLRRYDMGLIADVVPNHMSASSLHNAWWFDVLENGPASQFASYFDIEWSPSKADLNGKVLLPILGGQYGDVLERGELQVCYERGAFKLYYFEHQLPLAPRSYLLILLRVLETLEASRPNDDQISEADYSELLSIITSIKNLPMRNEQQDDRLVERRREKEIIKRRIQELMDRDGNLRELIETQVTRLNGVLGDPHSFDLLDSLLEAQAYRLSYWRVAGEEINYRRFFDINELAALRTELPEVFYETHKLLFELLDEGIIDGLRVDHPDGLLDPQRYFSQLQLDHFLRLCDQENARMQADKLHPESFGSHQPNPFSWHDVSERLSELWQVAAAVPGSTLARPLFIIVEKILGTHEQLPDDWTVHGTVGYEFLNAVNGLFVDAQNERPMTSYYAKFTGENTDFGELAYECKRLVVRMSMASELNVLGHALDSLSEQCRHTRDFTQSSLTRALQEVISAFDVYRSYIKPGCVLERDRKYIESAVNKAIDRNPAVDGSVFLFLKQVLLLSFNPGENRQVDQAIERFTGRFQQLTGPIMAKSVEDTAFYRFNRLASLNEVGGEPARFGLSVDEFHEFQRIRLQRNPNAMSASTTHDSKRSEDVRARINVLSEIPRIWKERVQRWSKWNNRWRTRLDDGVVAPSRNAEYLLYQTIIGSLHRFPLTPHELNNYLNRLTAYLIKVEREAKVETSWVRPDEAYEKALEHFIEGILMDRKQSKFLSDVLEFSMAIAKHGTWNSLSQLVLKATSPGIPDFYQGSEFTTLTLVDPDNRRPIDWKPMVQGMRSLSTIEIPHLVECIDSVADDGLIHGLPSADWLKFLITSISLNLRKQLPDLFRIGSYEPLDAVGEKSMGIIAFARQLKKQTMLTVASRFSASLHGFDRSAPIGNAWRDSHIILPDSIPSNRFQNIFTGSEVRAWDRRIFIRDILASVPVGILFVESE